MSMAWFTHGELFLVPLKDFGCELQGSVRLRGRGDLTLRRLQLARVRVDVLLSRIDLLTLSLHKAIPVQEMRSEAQTATSTPGRQSACMAVRSRTSTPSNQKNPSRFDCTPYTVSRSSASRVDIRRLVEGVRGRLLLLLHLRLLRVPVLVKILEPTPQNIKG